VITRNSKLLAVSLAALSTSAVACSEAEPSDDDESAASGGKADDIDGESTVAVAVTASSVHALDESFAGIDPKVERFVVGDPFPTKAYLRPMSALGPYGPAGAFGPLGVLGPVGDRSWSPSSWVSLGAPWDGFAGALTDAEGPLSKSGPLGANGPLGTDYWPEFAQRFPELDNDFITQLEPGGVFAPLGKVGPLGALGPLGPLGPVGAHGYSRDDVGNYVPEDRCHHDGDVCRTIDVAWTSDETRTYELFEAYAEKHALAMTDNDTSFMVEGEIVEDEDDVFAFTSSDDRFVTIVAFGTWTKYPPATAAQLVASASLIGFLPPRIVPGFVFPFASYDHDSSFDDIDLVLEIDVEGVHREVVSDTAGFVDWIHVRVPAGAALRTHVQLASSWSAPWRVNDPSYRLFVVGSTPELASTRVRGPHQIAVDLPTPEE
jgi:hypothetical protein